MKYYVAKTFKNKRGLYNLLWGDVSETNTQYNTLKDTPTNNVLGEFDTLEELQEILSGFSESDVDVKWNNPFFEDIDDLIEWSERIFRDIKSIEEFKEEVDSIVKYGIDKSKAMCYLVNYYSDFICSECNGGCGELESCKEIKRKQEDEREGE